MFVIDRLTPEQRAAATHDGGNLLIVAGAGTGKTTTLAARLSHLVTTGTDPSRILLLTFSRRAAAELLTRATSAAGRDVTSRAWAGTFHAVANRLLRRYGRALGLDPSFTVLDQGDAADMLGLVRDERTAPDPSLRKRRTRHRTMADILSRCVNTRTPLPEVLRRHYPWCADDRANLASAFTAYTARKREHHLLDFDDLLLCWAALLDHPAAGPDLRDRFDHVLVDEYQDTNALQADILDKFAEGASTITAVGDDAQAIYGFRAATVRNILEFPDRFKAEVARLEQSQRSTPALLAFTNALAAEAPDRHDKTLWTRRTGDVRPALVTCADEAAQSAAVCARVLDQLERGTPLSAQAVLLRANHHSDLLELELSVRGIPYVKYGGLRFLEAAHVKDLLACCRVVENPADEVGWFRILQLLDGIGPATARRLAVHLSAPATGDATPRPPLARLASEGVEHLLTTVADARRLRENPGAQIEAIRTWLDPLVEARHGDGTARLADLDQLVHVAAAAPSLERFLVDLVLDPPASTSELAGPPLLEEDFLTLSTIHAAKGLEWDVIHVLHLADGHIPSDMATGDDAEIEEERRLLYVACTRARDALYMYFPLRYHFRRRGRDDGHGYAQLSRFLTPAVLAYADHQGCARGWGAEEEAEAWSLVEPVSAGTGIAAVDQALTALWEA